MKVLLDECVDPKAARFFSSTFQIAHLKDLGWLGIKNGGLVKRASGSFDLLFTIDSNMRHQTSLRNLPPIVVVAEVSFKSLEDYQEPVRQLELRSSTFEQGKYHVLTRRT